MTADRIPDSDHVVRYVGRSNIDDEVVLGGAFLRGARGQDLSVNWLEYFAGRGKQEQLAEVRRLSRLNMRESGRLVELNVGATKEYVQSEYPQLDIVKTPLAATAEYEADPSHGDIVGLPDAASTQASLIGDMIAECVHALHPALSES